MIRSFQEVMDGARQRGPKVVAVACAHDKEVLLAVDNAKKAGIADAILIGNQGQMKALAQELKVDLSPFQIIDCQDQAKACLLAVELVSQGKAHMVMKGLVDTSVVLKAVLDPQVGLRTGNVLSHVAVFDIPHYDRLFFVTDAAMNIAPDVHTKKQIIQNAVQVAHALDVAEPKVGVLCAKEKPDPKMPDTLHAQELAAMNQRGEMKGCLVSGPLALDNAVSVEAARHKGIDHPVAGKADILLVPDIEAGNILYKSLVFFAQAKNAGIIVGAKAPVILTSRADSDETKLYSIALGVHFASRSQG